MQFDAKHKSVLFLLLPIFCFGISSLSVAGELLDKMNGRWAYAGHCIYQITVVGDRIQRVVGNNTVLERVTFKNSERVETVWVSSSLGITGTKVVYKLSGDNLWVGTIGGAEMIYTRC